MPAFSPQLHCGGSATAAGTVGKMKSSIVELQLEKDHDTSESKFHQD